MTDWDTRNGGDFETPMVQRKSEAPQPDLSGWWFVLGAVIGGGLYVRKACNQRTTTKFFRSLVVKSEHKLSAIGYSVLPREGVHLGRSQEPITRLNVNDPACNAVMLIGERRSGRTVFLANSILNDMFPWWFSLICPPRGLFLTGTGHCETIDHWLESQIPTSPGIKKDPWKTVVHLLQKRREEQRVRRFLFSVFRTHWPAFLRPQPVIIVVDQVEHLLESYRASFLVRLNNHLLKEAFEQDLFRLVLVVESENAVKALRLMERGPFFTIIQAPKVSRDAVVRFYGEDTAKIYEECDRCIGIAVDYIRDKKQGEVLTAKEYTAQLKQNWSDQCLRDEISREEYIATREQLQKKKSLYY